MLLARFRRSAGAHSRGSFLMFNAWTRSVGVLFVLLGLLLAGCPATSGPQGAKSGEGKSGDTKRLMFVTNGDDPFWDALLSGLKEGDKTSYTAPNGREIAVEVLKVETYTGQ